MILYCFLDSSPFLSSRIWSFDIWENGYEDCIYKVTSPIREGKTPGSVCGLLGYSFTQTTDGLNVHGLFSAQVISY